MIHLWITLHLMKPSQVSLVETYFFLFYESMTHGFVKVKTCICNVVIGIINFYFKYSKCFLKVCSWTIICLYSISICVVFIRFMAWCTASTITLLLLLIISMIGEKILLHFHLTHVFVSAIKVFEKFSIGCWGCGV